MTHPPFVGFRQISRHDKLFKERIHDPYRARHKLPEPTVCPQCGALFHEGRWQWGEPPAGAHQETCAACQRINDNFPAGFVTLNGEFFAAHREEIMHVVHNVEKRERSEHPFNRIMAIKEKDGGTLVTTTDIHLARGIGEAINDAYQGDLEFHYNPDEYLLRVHWTR
ncbi:MAG TPA: BCAM0308 family protein [Nitrosospira sp.]|nr:BCAM0308 family protein [Nitrosospira sp.]